MFVCRGLTGLRIALAPENMKCTQPTQGRSQIKTALKDSLRFWHQEEEHLEHLALRPAGLECRSSTGLEETDTPLLEGTHKVSHAVGPRTKQYLHRNLG